MCTSNCGEDLCGCARRRSLADDAAAFTETAATAATARESVGVEVSAAYGVGRPGVARGRVVPGSGVGAVADETSSSTDSSPSSPLQSRGPQTEKISQEGIRAKLARRKQRRRARRGVQHGT